MKRNIWLALLCLSGGLSQNVMGALGADDLNHFYSFIVDMGENHSEENKEIVRSYIKRASQDQKERIISVFPHVENMLVEGEQNPASVAQQRNVVQGGAQNGGQFDGDSRDPVGQNAQVENLKKSAQTGSLSDDDANALYVLIFKPIDEMTKEDFNTLDRLGTQKMSVDQREDWDHFLSTKKAPLADRRSVVEKEGAVIAKEQVPQPAEKPVEQVTKEQITKDQRECAALIQTWIRKQSIMKTEEKLRFMELLNKKHISEKYSEETLQRYKTEISKSLNDANADRIQSNQIAQENAPEGPQNNMNGEEEDVLGAFADLVKDVEEGKGSKSKKDREIKQSFVEASADVIADDTMTIDEKVSKLNGLSDLFPKKNKKKQANVIVNQLKIATKKTNIGKDNWFRKQKAFDLFWKFCATTPAKERTNAFFNAACVRDEDDFIQFMKTHLSPDKSSKKQLKALIQMLPEVTANLSDESEVELSKILARNVLGIDDRNENAWNYINQKEYKDVFKILTNGKSFFEKEVKDIEKKLKKSEEEGGFDSLLNEVEGVISAFNDLIENGWIGKKDKPAIDKKLSSMKVRIINKIDEDQQED